MAWLCQFGQAAGVWMGGQSNRIFFQCRLEGFEGKSEHPGELGLLHLLHLLWTSSFED